MYHGCKSGNMKNLITLLIIFLILTCFCLALAPVQAEQELLWSYTTDGWVKSVAITPDGNYIAAVSSNGFIHDQGGTVYLLDRQDDLLWSYTTDSWVGSVAITPDGKYIAAGSDDGYVHLLDRQGNLLWSCGIGDIGSVAITTDGNYIATSCAVAVCLLDRQGNLLWYYLIDSFYSPVVITPDGNYIAAGSQDGYVYLLDRQGNLLWSYETGTGGTVKSVAITPDGNYIAAGSWDNNVYLLDRQGNLLWSYKTGGSVYPVAITPDGNYIAAGSWDGIVYILDRQGKKLGSWDGNIGAWTIAITTDGNYIAVDGFEDNVYLLDRQGNLLWSYETGGGGVAITPDGNYIATGGDNNVYLFAKGTTTPTPGTAKVYVNNEDDDALNIKLWIGDESKETKNVPSGLSNFHFGDYELSPGDYKFKIKWNDPDTDEEYEDEITATISVGESKTVTLTATKHLPGTGTAKVYVNNEDDDALNIKLWIGDEHKETKNVPSGSSNHHFGDYELSPGDHNFKIKWNDPDHDRECTHIITVSISAGESKTVTLIATKHLPRTGTAKVYVNNEDDDDLDIKLWIGEEHKETKNVHSGSSNYHFGDYELSPGDYKFKIKWEDPDTYEWYEDEATATISAGESKTVTLTATKHLPITGTAKVYVKNEDDDDLDIKLGIGEEYKGVKNVPSGSSNYHFGDYVLSPGDYKFKIKWEDPDTYEWYEDEATATITVGESTTVTLTATKHLPITGTAKVYVKNEDDDDLMISLYIDDKFTGTKTVSAGSSKFHFGDYELSLGKHIFTIKWEDYDTNEEYESTSVIKYIFAEAPKEVLLTTEKHLPPTKVYVRNEDDDDLLITLYIDSEYQTWRNVPSGSLKYPFGEYELSQGDYIFEIEWEDPDTGKSYKGEILESISADGLTVITLTAAKHRATTAEVYVMSKYSDTLEIVLEIDGKFEDRKEISPSSSMRFYGSYVVSPDSPIFVMSWDDPDTGEACRVNKEETFEEEDVKQIKLIAEKHGPALEVDVKPYVCVLEGGDKENIDIRIKNTGDTTAESVSGIIESKNTVTAFIGGSKTPYIGDIKPGETWTETFVVPYIKAKKEGETTIEVKVRSDNAGEVLKDITVRVVKPGTIATELSSLGESQPKRPSPEVVKEILGSTNEFSVMYEEIEEEISDSFSKDGVDAALTVQSSGKAGNAVEGKKVKIALKITNKNDKAIAVKAAIIPSAFFTYKEGKYDATHQKIDRNIWDFVETIDVWSWKSYTSWVQFHLGGKAYVLEPSHVLIFSAEITPEQTGYLDINGDIYYEPIGTQTLSEFYISYIRGLRAVETDLDKMEHVTLAKSIYVGEKKKCSLWGWLCR